jgi:hypothetical protein
MPPTIALHNSHSIIKPQLKGPNFYRTVTSTTRTRTHTHTIIYHKYIHQQFMQPVHNYTKNIPNTQHRPTAQPIMWFGQLEQHLVCIRAPKNHEIMNELAHHNNMHNFVCVFLHIMCNKGIVIII